MVRDVIVLGGGSAGFLAALALKTRLPRLAVRVIRSKEFGIIGVGEGSTPTLTGFLHEYLKAPFPQFLATARPTWKLGLRFLWGRRDHFYYPFGPGLDHEVSTLPRPVGFYCHDQADLDAATPLIAYMAADRAFPRRADGRINVQPTMAYHVENEAFVAFLEQLARGRGVVIEDDTVQDVRRRDDGGDGVASLRLASGREATADLYVDCSGFASVLLGKAMGEPFIDFTSSLFCDRAVVGGWARRAGEVIHPYTTCETMPAGWCWQIEHEHRVNRGYVYASAFANDEQADADFRARCPAVERTRVVRFTSGRYRDHWVGNVVAIGNASGFVEPLEATALGVIATQARTLADALHVSGGRPSDADRRMSNLANARGWDAIRGFIALHYKFNDRLDTPFWRACRAETDVAGAAAVVEHYTANGPDGFWETVLLDPMDQFKFAGYASLLVGMGVEHARPHAAADDERAAWGRLLAQNRRDAEGALTIGQALAAMRAASELPAFDPDLLS